MSTDAIVILKHDHTAVKRLFRELANVGDDPEAKQALVHSIIAELTAHTYVENEIMYPEVRAAVPELDGDILESYEEHHVVILLCQELGQLASSDEHFDAKVTVLRENVLHHVEEEESEWFPKVREGMGRRALREMGERILVAKESAPRAPDDPSAVRSARHAAQS